ncbi:hypothetical protein ACFX2G_034466 [Malus domestica]
MWKMSTREQCQVLLGGKKAKYVERLRWECPIRYEEGLSIFPCLPSTLKKWYVVSGKLMLHVKIVNKLYPRKSGSRSSENDASSVFEQKAILLGVWLLRFGERCLFDF